MGHPVLAMSNARARRIPLCMAMAVLLALGQAAVAQELPSAEEEPAQPRERGVTVELREAVDRGLGPDGLDADAEGAARPDGAVPPPANEWMEQQVEAVEETLREARFRSAMGISAQLRRHPAASPSQRQRLGLVHATAALALGDEESSQASLLRLLEVDPGFELGEAHSPRLRRALERARGGRP